MIKSASIALVTALVIVSLSGCVSAPAAPSGPDDCLVVVKCSLIPNPEIPREDQSARNYTFLLSSGYASQSVQLPYTAILVREPAVTIAKIRSRVMSTYLGADAERQVGVALPYKPGCLVIADQVFERRTEKMENGSGWRSYAGFRPITDKERAELLELLRADGGFSSWKM